MKKIIDRAEQLRKNQTNTGLKLAWEHVVEPAKKHKKRLVVGKNLVIPEFRDTARYLDDKALNQSLKGLGSIFRGEPTPLNKSSLAPMAPMAL